MREPACTQKEYPVYNLTASDYKNGLQSIYERLTGQTNTEMYWVVDAFTRLSEDFDFSYYPTQYDKEVVHIWKHDGTSIVTGVKLVHTGIKFESHYSILQNAFDKLKEMPTIASCLLYTSPSPRDS